MVSEVSIDLTNQQQRSRLVALNPPRGIVRKVKSTKQDQCNIYFSFYLLDVTSVKMLR